MNQSALIAAALFAMFIVFVASRGRLATYTDVLWGGGGKGGGTVAPEKSKTSLDKEGDGIDRGDLVEIAGKLMPYPFSIPFEFIDQTEI